MKTEHSALFMALIGGLFMLPKKAMSKIVDPAPIVMSGVKYQSHANYVEAIDVVSEKILWHAILYPDVKPKHPDPSLEQDVQWNIVTAIKIAGNAIEARDSKGQIYLLDRKSGKVVSAAPGADGTDTPMRSNRIKLVVVQELKEVKGVGFDLVLETGEHELLRRTNANFDYFLHLARESLKDKQPVGLAAHDNEVQEMVSADQDIVHDLIEEDPKQVKVWFLGHDGIHRFDRSQPEANRAYSLLVASKENQSPIWFASKIPSLAIQDVASANVAPNDTSNLFRILDRLEGEKTWAVKLVEHITLSSLQDNKEQGNDVFGVFVGSSGSIPFLRQIELRLARKGTPPKGLIILDLRPERLAVQEVLGRYGKEAAPQLGTTDAHDRSVYYEFKRSSGIIRFGAADMASKWIMNIVIDRFDEMKGDNPTVSTTPEPERATFGLLGHSATRKEFETFVKGLKRIDGTDSEIEGTGGGACGYEALDAQGMRYQVHMGNGSWPSWVEQVKNEKVTGKQKEPRAAASATGKEKISGQLIETAEFTGVLFPSGKKAFLHTVDPTLAEYAYPWDPSQNDIVVAEKAVQLYLDQHAPQILKKLRQYKRQYSGIAIHRNHLIHMNFFCDNMGRHWMSEEVVVEDGGDCYFQVNYSVSYGKVVDFTVNGAS